ncbi:MAG TPA: hypothetical protein VMS98_05110 [Thermoanaerobaculia bacterium]|nr:hypothetical protein [Thermoanaerobaculia bacterium]
MKKTALILIACMLAIPMAGFADEALYKAKCLACHGADGKKSAKKDISSDAVQSKSDEDLVKYVTTHPVHKTKITSPEQAQSVVKFLRTLKK